MEDLAVLFNAVLSVFRYEFSIYGVTLSMWQVFLFSGFAGVVAWFIGRWFLND